MMRQIPHFKEISLAFQAVRDKGEPECSSDKLAEQFHHTEITDELKKAEVNKAAQSNLSNLGDTEDLRKINWSNPREACETVKKLHLTKSKEMRETAEKTASLLQIAKKTLISGETFEKLEAEIDSFLEKILQRRIKLLTFIQNMYFNGYLDEMVEKYRGHKDVWQDDLRVLIAMLEEGKNASDLIHEEFKKGKKYSCNLLPEKDHDIKKEYDGLVDMFIGALYLFKQIGKCLKADSMLKVYFMKFGVKEIKNILKKLLGGVIVLVIELTLALVMISFFIVKALKAKNPKRKYTFFGRAAGVTFNIVMAILLNK